MIPPSNFTGGFMHQSQRPGEVWYLASPYSHKSPYVREMRYLLTMKKLAALLHSQLAVYSPIVHCHELAKVAGLPGDAAFWRTYNFAMLARCQGLYVFCIDGWKQSVGVEEEIAEAANLHLPVVYLEEETF
jgi:hypothetical protein